MYVDASALTAILKNEPERSHFLTEIEASDEVTTSVISVFETIIALSTMTGSCVSALTEVRRLLEEADIAIMPLGGDLLLELAVARDRYGRGSGQPAKLNLGDCVSYAAAKAAGTRLLYKGDDFVHTDLA